jgi:hypothetical protein
MRSIVLHHFPITPADVLAFAAVEHGRLCSRGVFIGEGQGISKPSAVIM